MKVYDPARATPATAGNETAVGLFGSHGAAAEYLNFDLPVAVLVACLPLLARDLRAILSYTVELLKTLSVNRIFATSRKAMAIRLSEEDSGREGGLRRSQMSVERSVRRKMLATRASMGAARSYKGDIAAKLFKFMAHHSLLSRLLGFCCSTTACVYMIAKDLRPPAGYSFDPLWWLVALPLFIHIQTTAQSLLAPNETLGKYYIIVFRMVQVTSHLSPHHLTTSPLTSPHTSSSSAWCRLTSPTSSSCSSSSSPTTASPCT